MDEVRVLTMPSRGLELGRAALALASIAGAAAAQAGESPLRELVEKQGEEIARLHAEIEKLYGREGGDGPFVETASGETSLRIGALLQVNALASGARDDRFDLRRMRFEFEGEIERRFLFNVEPFFTETDVELEEAWIGAKLCGERARLMFGRMKEPFSLEEMSPRKHWDFAEFSILNQIVPAEDSGVTLLGATEGGALEYGAAVYNGSGGDERNEDKDVAGRLVWHPFASYDECALRGFQIGAAATAGRADADVGGAELVNETRQPFLAFEPAGMLDGERTRAGLEAAWLRGPYALFAEAVRVEQDMTGTLGSETIGFDGWYVAGSWVLTGEEKSFKGVAPVRPLGEGGGRGAWQLAARYSRLSLDDDLVSTGIVMPASFPGDVSTLDVGLNWYATKHARVRFHVVRTMYGDPIDLGPFGGGTVDTEDALLVQLQLGF